MDNNTSTTTTTYDWNSQASQWWKDEEIPYTVLLVMVYLAFILRIGPAYMKNQPAYKLKTTLLVYNAVQVLISVFLVIICLREVMATGLLPRKCYLENEEYFKLAYIGNRLYFFAKITELLDTIFFVLRKKNNQVSFLHVYHHSGMVLCHIFYKHHPVHVTSVVRVINSGVHVVMYTYYSLAALGPSVAKYLTWKKYLTSLQLVQFVFFIVYAISTDLTSECPFSLGHTLYMMFNVGFILILFSDFYKQNYLVKNKNRVNTVGPCMLQTINGKIE